MSTALLIIDAQNDFCSTNGSLYVPGAEKDCIRLSSFILKNQCKIDALFMTLDMHPCYHIAHPIFWKDKNGNSPAPYTEISYESYSKGLYTPSNPKLKQAVEDYLLALENRGRYTLTIWPPHCLIATNGYCVYPAIYEAAHSWELSNTGKNINYVYKSPNCLTEHYSAIHAEVPDPADATTRTNFQFIDNLKVMDNIVIAGEALSHCVANTIRDLAIYISPQKLTLLTDCTSSVKGYESTGNDFIEELKLKGMKIVNSTSYSL